MSGVVITNGAPVAGSVGGPPRIARVATQFDKTNNTLANVTGLTFTLGVGTHKFEAVLFVTAPVGGCSFVVAGTVTASAVVYDGLSISEDATNQTKLRYTALGSSITGLIDPVVLTVIRGTITVSVAGTLTIQFAQTTSDVTASSVLVGSTLEVQAIS
jgi:hypothetical protein